MQDHEMNDEATQPKQHPCFMKNTLFSHVWVTGWIYKI